MNVGPDCCGTCWAGCWSWRRTVCGWTLHPFAFHGPLVPVAFTSRDNEEMARRLEEEYHILVSCADGGILLCPAPGVTFEDMDYVQGAVYRLLLEQS